MSAELAQPVYPLIGGIAFTVYPVAVARAHDIFEPEDVIPVSAALLLSFGLGASIGPILASLTMTGVKNPNGFFLYCATVGGLYAVTGYYLRKSEMITHVPVDEQVANAQLRTMLHGAIQKLDPKYKEPFELKVFDGLSIAELSEELGLSEGGIKTRLHRARAHVKKALLRGHGTEIGAFIGV